MSEEKDPLLAYRESLQSDITQKEKEYHTTITYISAGALAFFLTLNDKFFILKTGHGQALLFTSLGCLLLSVVLYVPANMVDVRADRALMDKVDYLLENGQKDDGVLLRTWKRSLRWSQYIYNARLVLMVLGVILEVIFVVHNI